MQAATQPTEPRDNRQDLGNHKMQVVFDVPPTHAAPLWSALDEIRNEIGGRLEGQHKYAKQDSLTYAIAAIGPLMAALTKATGCGGPGNGRPCGDPNYAG